MTEKNDLLALAKAAKDSSQQLSLADKKTKASALNKMADALIKNSKKILDANKKDCDLAKKNNKPDAFLERLLLNEERITAMADSIRKIASLPEPIGQVLSEWDVPSGLHIKRVSVPLGVIAVIYEARPNVTADAAALCLKSGNAVILRSSADCFHSATAILNALQQALSETNLPRECVQMPSDPSHEAVQILLSLDEYIDVVVPRGGPGLIREISRSTRIPLFKHLAGLCHTYVHKDADLTMATNIILNAKMRRPGICGATETLLIDDAIVGSHLPTIIHTLLEAGCEVRGDEKVQSIDSKVKKADKTDWDTEYLAPIISIKIVADLEKAITHVNLHGSLHTEAIITNDQQAAQRFMSEVGSAIVMHNASTQFADGGEFGMGAEIGIATGKLHARGPVGIEQLTTFKYEVLGSGQTRA